MGKQQIILVYHGSRRESAMAEAEAFVRRLSDTLPGAGVSLGFLQFCSPTVEEAFTRALAENPDEIVVFPMFSLTGLHVEKDIPALVEAFRTGHPQTPMRLLPHLAAQPLFLQWVEHFLRDTACLSSHPT